MVMVFVTVTVLLVLLGSAAIAGRTVQAAKSATDSIVTRALRILRFAFIKFFLSEKYLGRLYLQRHKAFCNKVLQAGAAHRGDHLTQDLTGADRTEIAAVLGTFPVVAEDKILILRQG